MIVISNHSWMESVCVISAVQTAPEWLSALDDSDGDDLRNKRSAGTSTDKCILYFCRETPDNLTVSAVGSTGCWDSWMTVTSLQWRERGWNAKIWVCQMIPTFRFSNSSIRTTRYCGIMTYYAEFYVYNYEADVNLKLNVQHLIFLLK